MQRARTRATRRTSFRIHGAALHRFRTPALSTHTFRPRIDFSAPFPVKPLLFLLLALPALGLAQGALTPGSAPAPTMRTLDQVDARLPLQADVPGITVKANNGFTITAPGSYVLTADLTVASGNAIEILSSNVTLDLNGFTLASTAAVPEGDAIVLGNDDHPVRHTRIFNGRILSGTTFTPTGATRFTGTGFRRGIAPIDRGNGAYYNTDAGTRLDRLTVIGVYEHGLFLGEESRITRCRVRTCSSVGLAATVVAESEAEGCDTVGIWAEMVIDCTGSAILGDGIQADHLALNSRGHRTGDTEAFPWTSDGFVSNAIAIGCVGTNTNGNGLKALLAAFCAGVTPGNGFSETHGLTANLAVFCVGDGTSIALSGTLAIGCTGIGGGALSIPTGSAFLMPAP